MSCTNLFIETVVHNVFNISQLSDADTINVVGHYNKLVVPEPKSDLLARGYSPDIIEALNKAKKVGPPPEVISCNLRFKRHLKDFDYPLFNHVWFLFESYERGVLPFEGSLSDQPAQIMDLFSLLKSLKTEQEQKLTKEIERNGRSKLQNQNRAGRQRGPKGTG